MKKVLLFVAVIAAVSFVSCKKDRKCTCTSYTAGGVSIGTSTDTYVKSLKKDVRPYCLSVTHEDGSKTTCELK